MYFQNLLLFDLDNPFYILYAPKTLAQVVSVDSPGTFYLKWQFIWLTISIQFNALTWLTPVLTLVK